VGAGSAGAALAARLAEQDPALTVLLLEAGGSDDVLNIDVPAAAIKLQRKAESDWLYQTEPQTHAHTNMQDSRGNWPRGKVMGGSSSLNYMLFVRGAPADFDSWAASGAGEEWSFKSLLPYFQRLENIRAEENDVPASPLRGTAGPMPCRTIISPQPATRAFLDAAAASGHLPANPDYNAESIFGVGTAQYNVKGGKRFNTSTAYVAPALLTRQNLHGQLCRRSENSNAQRGGGGRGIVLHGARQLLTRSRCLFFPRILTRLIFLFFFCLLAS